MLVCVHRREAHACIKPLYHHYIYVCIYQRVGNLFSQSFFLSIPSFPLCGYTAEHGGSNQTYDNRKIELGLLRRSQVIYFVVVTGGLVLLLENIYLYSIYLYRDLNLLYYVLTSCLHCYFALFFFLSQWKSHKRSKIPFSPIVPLTSITTNLLIKIFLILTLSFLPSQKENFLTVKATKDVLA